MLKRVIGIILIAAALAMGAGVATFLWFDAPVAQAGEALLFAVEKGESLESIARRLEEHGIVRSALALRVYARLAGTEQQFRQGTYRIPAAQSMGAVHALLTSGRQVNVRLTVPEGYTSGQIARLLEEKGICPAKEFLAAVKDKDLAAELGLPASDLEGYLFPDTYLFAPDYPAQAVARFMAENFLARLDDAVPGWRSRSATEVRRAVIIASIVEREYLVADEAPLMASVFYNRLKINKPLESCATVVYVMTEEEGLPHPTRLLYRDLDRESPYNTYRHKGLPPGPISNPGLVALRAAFTPATTNYLYFVLKGASAERHQFSTNFADHSQATVLYLKGKG